MGKIRRFLRNLSIKKTFMLYMVLFLLLAVILTSITMEVCSNIRSDIYFDRADELLQEEGGKDTDLRDYYADNYLTIQRSLNAGQQTAISVCQIIEGLSIPVYFSACIIVAGLLFYRNKLKKPIVELEGASEKIAQSNLDFQVSYNSRDEMGRLCQNFETMRASLDENNRRMWRSMEERKRLNAVFSHDLRTPLTVLRGYTDLLAQYLPGDQVPKKKLLETVNTMSNHITRLENYVSSMNMLQRLEDITVEPDPISSTGFLNGLRDSAEILCGNAQKGLEFVNKMIERTLNIDGEIITQVFENLISNAIRYSKTRVCVTCTSGTHYLCLSVEDDGPGFTPEGLHQATHPFYRSEETSDTSHFGLGLNICKILCEKHGGSMRLANGPQGGAQITVSFSLE